MTDARRFLLYLLFIASGFAGLIYESIWTHYLKLYLGHAAYAQSLVLVVFMGGLAGGAALCARASAALRNPLRTYALIEGAIGVLAAVFHPVFVALTGWSHDSLLPSLGSESAALISKLLIATLLILPQTLLLGATFPLMSAGLVRATPHAPGRAIAMLYFTNSLGGAAGILASGFVLVAAFGLPGTLDIAAAINITLAIVVLAFAAPQTPAAAPSPAMRGDRRLRLLLTVAFLTGLASFVYEIVWIRMISLVIGASTHAFELMLSTFILGLALGGLAVRRHVEASPAPERLLGWIQVAMGLLALATLVSYDATFGFMQTLMSGLARTDTGYTLFNIAAQSIAALVMLPATFCAGMTLPLITAALLRRGAGESAIGRVYAANTIGSIAGVVLAVHVGLPALGLKGSLMLACAIDAGLGLFLLARFASQAGPGGTARIEGRAPWRRRPFVAAALGCLIAFIGAGLGARLDPNKMTAGVFRYGDLEGSQRAKIVFAKDGKTATVHIVDYGDALSIRTNGKSDGSLNAPGFERGTDEITMVLTGALPLALKPDARNAAIIGIGTGLTTHTLLQKLDLESVDTIEIEAAMAEAARHFLPRNAAAFADPRSHIRIDDAKTFFSTHNRRYDIVVSEPSNPWVSGVSGLFTREFYQRVKSHLTPGGVLVQWFQLYEIDTSLLASVMRSIGEEFKDYAVFAPSDHDLLIIASDESIELPPDAWVFDAPFLGLELSRIHVHGPGDLDLRYLGRRSVLEPLFASYGMPANSDFAPVLDLHAARHRFTQRSATEVVGLLNAPIPVLDLLEPARRHRPPNPGFAGSHAFEPIENARLAAYAREFLLSRRAVPEGVPTQLQKDLEIVRTRLVDCRPARDSHAWLHSLVRVARATNPFLSAGVATDLWARLPAQTCSLGLQQGERRWVELVRSIAARDAPGIGSRARDLIAADRELQSEAREFLVISALAGLIASGHPGEALAIWKEQRDRVARISSSALFRLLRCHAGDTVSSPCTADFPRRDPP